MCENMGVEQRTGEFSAANQRPKEEANKDDSKYHLKETWQKLEY